MDNDALSYRKLRASTTKLGEDLMTELTKYFHFYPALNDQCALKKQEKKVSQFREFQTKLLSGGIVNFSEHRAAWHTEFRNPSPIAEVTHSLQQIQSMSEQVRLQTESFCITDVVNIGIGGSDLGPKLICEAFSDEIDGPQAHFVSNLDTVQMKMLLQSLSARNTLFIVTSKSFRTIETIENMRTAKAWLLNHGVNVEKRMIAVTHNQALAIQEYQFLPSHVLAIPEWVGGRFSIWSAVGLICAIAFGFDRFYELHRGAYAMDQHFQRESVENNWPVQYASILFDALMNRKITTLGILPYAHRLRTFPAYLQQLFMESLGKNVNIHGEPVNYPTGPIVFGGVGTNAQHSFQQLMMQGTQPFIADFILPLTQKGADAETQAMVVANCLTQVKTLREGASTTHHLQSIQGDKPVNLIVLNALNFVSLGALLTFYEHAVASLAFFLNINPFDQWGVEYAKQRSQYYHEQMGEQLLDHSVINEILHKFDIEHSLP